MTRHNEMLDALFKYATEGIIIVNRSGSIVMVNPKAKELFGYEAQELEGKKMKPMNETNKRMNKIRNKSHFAETLDKG